MTVAGIEARITEGHDHSLAAAMADVTFLAGLPPVMAAGSRRRTLRFRETIRRTSTTCTCFWTPTTTAGWW